jgi:diguanylate cyclase (GGDEF)-like protein
MVRQTAVLLGASACLAVVAWVDFATGTELGLSPFYLFPIGAVGWNLGRTRGLAFALLSGVVWGVVDALGGTVYSSPAIAYWNASVRGVYFLIVVELLCRMRGALDRERFLSKTDSLTGIANRAGFIDRAMIELARLRRTGGTMSVACFDVDDFKQVNDTMGHKEGDEVLRTVAKVLRETLRETDVAARMGGDEFIVLITDSGDEGVRRVSERLHRALQSEAKGRGWPIGFSMGVYCSPAENQSVEDFIARADELMYRAKKAGKGRVEVESQRPEADSAGSSRSPAAPDSY